MYGVPDSHKYVWCPRFTVRSETANDSVARSPFSGPAGRRQAVAQEQFHAEPPEMIAPEIHRCLHIVRTFRVFRADVSIVLFMETKRIHFCAP